MFVFFSSGLLILCHVTSELIVRTLNMNGARIIPKESPSLPACQTKKTECYNETDWKSEGDGEEILSHRERERKGGLFMERKVRGFKKKRMRKAGKRRAGGGEVEYIRDVKCKS